MATVNKKYSIDFNNYDNYIKAMEGQVAKFTAAVKKITELIPTVVMKEGKWTDSKAQDLAEWWMDIKGNKDGCDYLNAMLKTMDALFKQTCVSPCPEVWKLKPKEQRFPNVQRYSAKGASQYKKYAKYRKSKFPNVPIKLPSKVRIVAEPDPINKLMSDIDAQRKIIKDCLTKIERYTKKSLIDPIDRDIAIAGFNSTTLSTKIKKINQNMDTFEKKFDAMASAAIQTQAEARDAANVALENSDEED